MDQAGSVGAHRVFLETMQHQIQQPKILVAVVAEIILIRLPQTGLEEMVVLGL
jgi:hypothetical protein